MLKNASFIMKFLKLNKNTLEKTQLMGLMMKLVDSQIFMMRIGLIDFLV